MAWCEVCRRPMLTEWPHSHPMRRDAPFLVPNPKPEAAKDDDVEPAGRNDVGGG